MVQNTKNRPDGKPLTRDPKTGRFDDEQLATILQNATEAEAGAFRARGIPEVLRVVEVMGIEQARSWGTCTVSWFVVWFGLVNVTVWILFF